jgi:hypothetical protein
LKRLKVAIDPSLLKTKRFYLNEKYEI